MSCRGSQAWFVQMSQCHQVQDADVFLFSRAFLMENNTHRPLIYQLVIGISVQCGMFILLCNFLLGWVWRGLG